MDLAGNVKCETNISQSSYLSYVGMGEGVRVCLRRYKVTETWSQCVGNREWCGLWHIGNNYCVA